MHLRIPKSGKLKVGRKTIFGIPGKIYNRFQSNDTAAFVPEQWAQESVRLLTEQMVYGATVHTDFSPIVAKYGEKVHTRKITELVGKRKQNDLDDIEDQDVSASDIEVTLNQRVYCSFIIGDGERSKSFKDLVVEYLEPAMRGNSRMLDQCIAGQVYQFLDNKAGGLGMLDKDNAHDYLLDARGVFNDNKVSMDNRWLGLASPTETNMQKVDLFKSAERIGDGGTALRNAFLGRVAGWNTFLELNTPSVRGAAQKTATTVNGAVAAGSTTIVATSAANCVVGNFITCVGDMTPLRITAISTNTLTVDRPTSRAIANGAALYIYQTALVNQASAIPVGQTHAAASDGYPANWMKGIEFDGAATPKVGQMCTFGAGTAAYCIIQVNGTEILLDRPLEAAIANNAVINLGPDGDYNFCYKREALALVNRPMALPMAGTGVRSAAAQFENMSLHVKISYDDVKEGHRVNIGGLFGIAVLDANLGGVLLG